MLCSCWSSASARSSALVCSCPLILMDLCCADLVFWDMPYVLGLAAWDVLLTDAELENFFQQVAVINRARWHPRAELHLARCWARAGVDDGEWLFRLPCDRWLQAHAERARARVYQRCRDHGRGL